MKNLFYPCGRQPALLLLISLAILYSSCATVLHGSKDDVYVITDPPDATVFIDGKECGKTPLQLSLPRKGRLKEEADNKKSYLLTVQHEGCQKQDSVIRRKISPAILISALGTLYMPIDFVTAAVYKLSPSQLVFSLQPDSNTFSDSEQKKRVLLRDSLQTMLKPGYNSGFSIWLGYDLFRFRIAEATTKTDNYQGFSLGLAYDKMQKSGIRFRYTHSAKESTPVDLETDTTAAGLGINTIKISANEQWWANDYQLECFTRLLQIKPIKADLQLSFGIGFRDTHYRYDSGEWQDDWKIVFSNETVNKDYSYEAFLNLSAGLRLLKSFGKLNFYFEPVAEFTSMPVYGTTEKGTLNYRIGAGAFYRFGKTGPTFGPAFWNKAQLK